MTPSSTIVVLLSCIVYASVGYADVSALRYNRFGRLTTRLQRQEVDSVTPYPAAGFRPDRQFDLPLDETPVFPTEQTASDFDAAEQNEADNSEQDVQQSPDLTYGAPARVRQFAPARLQAQSQRNFAAARLQAQSQRNFASARLQAQSQRNFAAGRLQAQPQRNFAAARLRAQPQRSFAARLQAQQQQSFDGPQLTYGAPDFPEALPSEEEPQAERLTAFRSARLSDNREDREEDDDNASDIELDAKMEERKAATAPAPAPAPTVAPTATVTYYPAGAVSFVQPLAAYVQQASAYNAANLYAKLQQAQPAAPAALPAASALAQPQFFAPSPIYQQQQFAPAQLQAW